MQGGHQRRKAEGCSRRGRPPRKRHRAAKEKTAPKMAAPAAGEKKTAKECEDEWRANKAANQAKGITEKAYVAECREGKAAMTPPAAPALQRKPRWRRAAEPAETKMAPPATAPAKSTADRTAPAAGQPSGANQYRRGRPGQGALPDRHGGLGQSRFQDLPLHRQRRLRAYETRRLYVREGRDGAGHARRQERETALNGQGARFTQTEMRQWDFSIISGGIAWRHDQPGDRGRRARR